MSAYIDAIAKGRQRVNELAFQYAKCLENGNHGMAAVLKGEESSARAYLQGMKDVGEILVNAGHDVTGGDR